MENRNQPIYPDPMRGAEQSLTNQNPYELSMGLTKREYLAGQIAIGLSVQAIAGNHNSLSQMEIDVPMFAVRIADALLAELDKPKLE